MKALILHSHGLGDNILLTPHLRELHKQGYTVDLMARKEVKESHLFDECPYVNEIIEITSPWSAESPDKQRIENLKEFKKSAKKYDWSGAALHDDWDFNEHKIDMTSRELNLPITDKKPEVFISDENWAKAKEFVGDRKFIFIHRLVKDHPAHTWMEAGEWAKKNFIITDHLYTDDKPLWETFDDINVSFAIMALASHRILCSSVFVHAAEAMGLYIDCLNYGSKDRKVLPLDLSKVLRIREQKGFCERENRIWRNYA